MVGSVLRDVRHGVRQLVRQPGFAAAAIASLALGIGLNTTLFSVVNGVLLRGSPIANPARLVEIYSGPNQDFPQLTLSYPDYLDVRRGADAFAGVAANAYVRGILATGDRGVLVTGEVVTANYFDVLGIGVPLGRAFAAGEDAAAGGAPVVVLSHGLWQRRFGGRADVVGDQVNLSGHSYTVVGVAPAGFTGTLPGIPTEFWTPVTMVENFVFAGVQWVEGSNDGSRLDRRGTRWLFVKGRLAEGRAVEEARAQVETVFARLRAEYPATNATLVASVVPASDIRFHPMLDGYVKAASAGLLAAVSLVLLVACANVANLLLARGAARRKELAIRSAVGADRRRLVTQLLTEGLVLAGVGGALGLGIAWWGGQALSGVGTDVFPMPISFDFSIDGTVLGFAFAASVATALVFGLIPALSSSKLDLVPSLKDLPEGDGGRRLTLKHALVVGQLALSLVLLVAGALLARGLLTAQNTDLGFDPRPIASLSFNLQMNGYDRDRAAAFTERAIEALGALPGVTAVSVASRLPLAPDINASGIRVPGIHTAEDDDAVVDTVAVGANYFTAVGVPIVSGRGFSREDVAEQRKVAIINETMARQYWPDGNALGARVYTDGFEHEPHEVIGIARDHKVRSVGEAPRAYLHLPAGPSTGIGLVVRTSGAAEASLPALRQTLWGLEPGIVFTEDTSAAEVAATTMAPTRIAAFVVGAFGALALVLATVGLYGVIAYSVSRRTREVGIRMALGATRSTVLGLVLGQGLRLALVGIVIGAVASAGVGQLLEALLYGVSSIDAAAYLGAAGLLLLVAGAANLLPALGAAKVDPMRALRSE
ncbi:MAG: ABC transporter permease [Acidobacteriota bacterium]